MVGKSSNDVSLLQRFRSLALLGESYHLGEVLASVGIRRNMLPAWIACRIGCEDTIVVAGRCRRRHDAIGSEDDRAVEVRELLTLFPPGISIVAYQVGIFLQSWIVVRRQHFSVGVNIHAAVLSLFEQLFNVAEVVSGYQDARTLADANVHGGNFWLSIGVCVGLVEQCHGLHSVAACL